MKILGRNREDARDSVDPVDCDTTNAEASTECATSTDDALFLSQEQFLELTAKASELLVADQTSFGKIAETIEMVTVSREKYRELMDILASKVAELQDVDTERAESLCLILHYMENLLEQLDGQPCSDDDKSVDKKVNRRNMMGTVAAMLSVGTVASMASQPASAMTGGAQNTPYLIELVRQGQASYLNAMKQLQGVIDTINGIQKLNNIFTNGIDGLLNLSMEESTKQVTATATAADKMVQYDSDMRKVDNKIANQPNSGACVDDAIDPVAEDGRNKRKGAGEGGGKAVTSAEVTTIKADDSAAKGEEAAKDISEGNTDALYGSGLIETPVPDTERDRENADKVFERMTAPPTELVRGQLLQLARTTHGKEAVRAVVTNKVRRSHAAGVVARYDQQRRSTPQYYRHMAKQLEASADTASRPVDLGDVNEDGSPRFVVNHRHVAYAQELQNVFSKAAVDGDDGKALSFDQILDLQVRAKNISQFHEYVRSSGPRPEPLLRELVSQNSLILQLLNEMRKSMAEMSQSQAISNMIALDSPVETARLNKLMKKAKP